MTWVTDSNGTQWIDYPQPKKRKPARALRFAEIKVGDQLMQRRKSHDDREYLTWHVVTDLWFDPVKGQKNHVAGEMVATVSIERDGSLWPRKEPHTKRGLASQGFHYADRDYIAERKALVDAVKDGSVVGIGMGRVIRQRPKIPGHNI